MKPCTSTLFETSPASPASAAKAINTLGLELLKRNTVGSKSTLLSPYSIQSAFVMAFAGAAGATRSEMAKTLHYPDDENELHRSFVVLHHSLNSARETSARISAQYADGRNPVTLLIANRLFAQEGFPFLDSYLAVLMQTYEAPVQRVDFRCSYPEVVRQINDWVAELTHHCIRDLVPPDGLSDLTRMVLVNAIYLKASWAKPFSPHATQLETFYVKGKDPVPAPTMQQEATFGYARQDGYSAVTLPYDEGDLQFLIMLPEAVDGLAGLEHRLTPEAIAECAFPSKSEIILHLPKFKIEPPLFRLSKDLQDLGMKCAFNIPEGTADFGRMASRTPEDYLWLQEIFHKARLDLDETGTEAAAATAFEGKIGYLCPPSPPPEPITVRVDHPFLFAVQHRISGACLFLGRVTDPR